jgi:glyoxylase-like metal-dependent hydrolase (beta-lactamase superfamily II)
MPKVTLKAIGCGGAFSEDGYLFHSCIMITVNGKNLLFDFGKDVWPWAMKAQGLTANDVDGVIISHEHHDHLGALGMLGLKRFDFINKPKHHTEYKPPFKYTSYWMASIPL